MKEDIIRIAREAGWSQKDIDSLLYIVTTVAARCADIADKAEPYQAADLIRKAFGVDK